MNNKNKNDLIEIDKKRSVRSKSPLIDKSILLLGIVAFSIIVAPIGYLIAQSINKPPKQLSIDISNKTNNPLGMNFSVDGCENCNKLVIRSKDGNIIFEESLEDTKDNRFRKYLIDKAEEGDNPNTPIKIFKNQTPNRLVDISFDISNSVIDRDNESSKNKADIKYSDFVFEKFKEYVSTNQGMLPQDKINARFYGPELKDNPCNSKLIIKYTEPEWQADIIYSRRNRQILIEIGDKLPSKFEKNGLEVITNDVGEIYRVMYEYYAKGIANPNPGCHFGTYLIPHLTQISDDVVNKPFENYEFILVTDGEFYLRDNEITGGKEVYATPKNYEVIKNYLQNKKNKEFIVNGFTICKNPSDRFIIVGMEYDNNLSYRNTVQQFYKELLKSCEVVFENF